VKNAPAKIGSPARIDRVPARARGVDVSITNERGERRKYHAQAVNLQIVQGGIEVQQDGRGCFAWFERCRLEVRAGRERVVLPLSSGAASSHGSVLAIVATSQPTAASLSDFVASKPVRRGTRKPCSIPSPP
jgi:hypothetical protein